MPAINCSYRRNSMCLGLCLLLCLCSCSWLEKSQKYVMLPSSWTPSSSQIDEVLLAVERYCEIHMADGRDGSRTADIQVSFGSSQGLTNSMLPPSRSPAAKDLNEFSIDGVKYSSLDKRIGSFIEENRGGRLRFIAVQHFLVDSQINPSFRPFTIYFNVENSKTGRNTVETWSKTATNSFELPEIIYSPGPPFYLE